MERENPGLIELRRGALVLAALSQLRAPQDGYALRRALAQGGMPVEEGALYPLLRRLEGQGLLVGAWSGDASPRRAYRLSDTGRRALATSAAQLCAAWLATLGAPPDTQAGAAW